MSFLSPLGFLWIGSVSVLVWLWRLAASKRQTRVASLIPFEHLIRRSSTRRRRVIINWLFWLQLAALLAAVFALMQPRLPVWRGKTILVIFDTSASMAARSGAGQIFDRAKQALIQRLARKGPADQVLVMTTAPAAPLTPQPVADNLMLTQLIAAQRVQQLGGQLSTTQRLGAALLGQAPDETWVVTDEPQPDKSSAAVRWISVGRSFPNVAILGVDALGSLCTPTQAHLLVTVQNFSDRPASGELAARQQGRQLAKTALRLPARGRAALPLPLQPTTTGIVELSLSASPDSLELDNRAWVAVEFQARLPVVVRIAHPMLAQAMAHWLEACSALQVNSEAPQGPYLLITDEERAAGRVPRLIVLPPADNQAVASHWIVSSEHPIASYLSPVDVVAVPINQAQTLSSATPVVSALVDGKKIPVVVADEQTGQRTVRLLFDITGQEQKTPVALVFFNSLRWLMAEGQTATTREALSVGGWQAGSVRIEHPDGSRHVEAVEEGSVRDQSATMAGVYQLTQASRRVFRAVNFFDPLESNTFDRVSTWTQAAFSEPLPPGRRLPRKTTYPLATTLLYLLLALLLIEWIAYSFRQKPAKAKP